MASSSGSACPLLVSNSEPASPAMYTEHQSATSGTARRATSRSVCAKSSEADRTAPASARSWSARLAGSTGSLRWRSGSDTWAGLRRESMDPARGPAGAGARARPARPRCPPCSTRERVDELLLGHRRAPADAGLLRPLVELVAGEGAKVAAAPAPRLLEGALEGGHEVGHRRGLVLLLGS